MAQDSMQTDEAPAPQQQKKDTNEANALPESSPLEMLKNVVTVLDTAVKLKETRLMSGRLMRLTAILRKHLSPDVLLTYVTSCLPAGTTAQSDLTACINQVASSEQASAMQTDEERSGKKLNFTESSTCEAELYGYLLVLMYAIDKKQFKLAKDLSIRSLQRLADFNRRTLDVIASRIVFYYSWAHECLGELESVRSTLLSLHQTAILRHDVIGQEVLLNLLLRNYLSYGLYDQAEAFRSKAQRDEVWRSHQQYSRYLYYLGRIRAIQLEYSEARDCLQQASRKAPSSALGFRVAADKWLILVRLLLGEVPDRPEFAVPGLATPLRPYFEITQAVRSGDLVKFGEVATRHDATFRKDMTRNLITRLHHNVLRTGLRRISLAYSRISLADVAARLHLSSADDAASIVAKAIRDGAIDAMIDAETGAMVSRDTQDVYVSGEPAEAFHARVAFCLDLHNEAVKALRYEPDAHKRKLEKPEERAERLAAEAELAKALEEEGDDL